jgi:Tfp pilus assembly protein PilX
LKDERGVALILALLVLSFLTILGGALLTTSTIDVWISDNYKTSTENLYLAEAGVDHARQILRNTSQTPSELLAVAAGPDHQLSTSTDLGTLLQAMINR